jgi:thiosulfate/3-mercaptopyruvate sulfurtransferase
MPSTPLISATDLMTLLAGAAPVVLLDCSFDLADPAAGERAYAAGHVPGAQYAHLDRDLSGAKTGRNGRHPLPQRDAFAATVGRWGITPAATVVCFDAQGGPYAARAWWLLRWLGHDGVRVLDGGLQAWQAAGGTLTAEAIRPMPAPPYPASPAPAMPTIEADALLAQLGRVKLIDARAAERFRGDVEPLDPVAGHIPGARQRFFTDNLTADGRFKPATELRAAFDALGADPANTVHQCGSGVTACHNLLAMAQAGLDGALLYPGSWSEWCADPARPVARGG